MTLRHTTAAILFYAAFTLGSVATAAVDENDIIDPRRSATATEAPVSPVDGIFADGGSSVGMFVTIFGYAIILGGLGVALWFLAKRGILRKPFSGSEGKLKVAETRMLGNRQFIMVVEYEDQKILLGVGPGKIDYLTSLSAYKGDTAPFETLVGKSAGGQE